MTEDSTPEDGVVHATLVFEREIPASVTDVFTAFADASVRAVWSAPPNDIIIYDHQEFAEGRIDRFRCGPTADPNIHGTTRYLEIVPNRRIVSLENLAMKEMKLAASLITTEFRNRDSGTRLSCTVQIASLVGPDMIRGYEDGNNGALDGLVRYLSE